MFYFRQCVVLFSLLCVFSIDCDDMYLPHSSSSSPPPFFQCVLISTVCGFADGFMKKRKEKKNNKQAKIVWCLELDGGWSGWLLPSLPVDVDLYVKTLTFIVEDGSVSRLKNKLNRMLTLSTYH